MGVRERIQYELARIAEQEEATRARIARENKKRELVRQIREEMAKIRGLDVGAVEGSPHTEVEDIPGWVKMVQSANWKGAAKPSQFEKDMQTGPREARLPDVDKPGEMHEEDSNKSEESEATEDIETDAKPGMTFEESVSALLSLIEEEKSPKPKATLMSKKPKDVRVNCSLKAVSEAKHKFEELSHNGASPTSPASQQQHILDHEINRLNVQRARESLLKTQQQKPSEAKADGGGKGVFRKKCSDIKEMLTKKTKKNDREPQLEGTRKHKKKVMFYYILP